MALINRDRFVILRDLAIFQVKLFLDGVKDLFVAQVALLAAAADLILPSGRRGRRFYAVMRAAERFDSWLTLYGAAESAATNEDGLFGASRAGSDTLLGKLEKFVIGHEETEEPARTGEYREAA